VKFKKKVLPPFALRRPNTHFKFSGKLKGRLEGRGKVPEGVDGGI